MEPNHRNFIDLMPLPRRQNSSWCIALLALLLTTATFAQHVFLEAEQFAETGGWDVDQQFMEQMGSSYLLAHGLGVPVKDAVTTATFAQPGQYRVWARTRDWVAPWRAPGAPGKFQLVINGKPLATTFGTTGADWHWQDGGLVTVGKSATVALHDLTGFEGRCDAVLFTKDATFTPPNDLNVLQPFRRKAMGLSDIPADGGEFDLVVVGGGIAGTSTAVSAARQGLKVCLIQDRPVLGGNGSSEVRVWPEGHTRQKPFPHVGEIVEEICPPRTSNSGNARGAAVYDDERKLRVVRAEPNITLMLEQRVFAVEAKDQRIVSVTAQHIVSAKWTKVRGKLFCDSTGDATVGFLAGADYEMSDEGNMGASNLWNVLDQSKPQDVLKCECKDKDALTTQIETGNIAAPFPRVPWALDLTDKPFPGRRGANGQWANTPINNLGGWFWESGFDKDPINDIERIRDLNMRAMYGAWDALKNVDKVHPNHRLGWSAFIAGKRESRRLIGDYMLKADDFRKRVQFEDPAFPNTWHIDIHVPHPKFKAGLKGEEFISEATTGKGYEYKGPYWAPYRCLYSRNISNLFMAGRNISVEREAIGPIRVMRTCGMMGEIVGKAAWICLKHQTSPRGVHQSHLSLLKELMQQPGTARRKELQGDLSNVTPKLPADTAKGYALAWQDEFEGNSLNKSEWNLRTGERFASMNKAENVSVADGMLRIALKKEKAGKLDYTSGGVISKREFKYGYYETSFRSPVGEGWHVSFWMMKNSGKSEGNRQEIDVCEHDTKDQTSYGTNLHIHAPDHKGLAGRRVKTPDLSKGFHTLGCEFTPKEIRTYFDGKLVSATDATHFKHDSMSIWLTTVGWAKLPWSTKEKIDDTKLPAFADFEYVRFYEKQSEEPPGPRTVIAYGDSLTEGKSGGDQAWVKLLEKSSAGKIKVINEGKGGRATGDGKWDFDKMNLRQPRADQIIIALGTNDSRDLKPESIVKAASNMRYMVDRARQCYGPWVKLLIVGPPNINKSALVATKPIANEREAQLKALGAAFEALAKEKQCEFVSLFGAVPESSMTKDGVHPDAAGHAAMAKVIAGKLLP